ncbi:MAG: PKD domain-containing protein [Thermoleophilaceae bacterium]
MRKALLSAVVVASALGAAVLPTGAAASTVTTPAGKTIAFSGGTVKGYSLAGSVDVRTGKPPQLDVMLSKPHESVSLTSGKNVKLTLTKDLSSGTVSADLGKALGKVSMKFTASGKATTTPAGKGCTGGSSTSRKGALNGQFTTKWQDTYFKTVSKSKLTATAFKSPKVTCTVKPVPGGGGGDKTIYLSGSPKGLYVSFSKAPNGSVAESVGTAFVPGAGPSISRSIYITAPASAFTIAANASSAKVLGSGQSLGGTLNYKASTYYTGGSNGQLTGDFWVEFVGKGVVRPFKASAVDGFLTKPGFKPPNQKPTAAFSTSQDPGTQEVAFDGFESSDPDGSIATYSWDFGDDSPIAHGATPNHPYATSGTKQVTLTVTDDKGATGTLTKDVVVAANQAPTAAFDWSEDDPGTLTSVSFDSSNSSDPDGDIVDYAWDFGDGSSVSHEQFPDHAFPDPPSGSPYTVTLTVTDNGGKTHAVNHSVDVTPVTP